MGLSEDKIREIGQGVLEKNKKTKTMAKDLGCGVFKVAQGNNDRAANEPTYVSKILASRGRCRRAIQTLDDEMLPRREVSPMTQRQIGNELGRRWVVRARHAGT